MKKKIPANIDTAKVLVQIQEQLAVLNNKLDDFINKSLTDLAQTLAAQKAAAAQRLVVSTPPAPVARPTPPQHVRTKYAIVCFQCGKDSELPFKPTAGRPVYCAECFAQRKSNHQAPKVTVDVKPLVEVQAPIEVKAVKPSAVKTKKKVSVTKKAVVKKPIVKKPVAKKAKKK